MQNGKKWCKHNVRNVCRISTGLKINLVRTLAVARITSLCVRLSSANENNVPHTFLSPKGSQNPSKNVILFMRNVTSAWLYQ